jgi:hypothetical protein
MVGRPVKRVMVAEGHGGERGRGKRENYRNKGKWLVFLADFGPDFLLSQAIKSTSIYRQWKRAILSTMEKNCNP